MGELGGKEFQSDLWSVQGKIHKSRGSFCVFSDRGALCYGEKHLKPRFLLVEKEGLVVFQLAWLCRPLVFQCCASLE